MSLYIQDEAALALMSFLLGAVLMVSYDLLRLFRLLVPHGSLWTGLEDILLDLLCSHDLFLIVLGEQRRGTGVRHWLCAFIYDGLRQNCQQECICPLEKGRKMD